MRVIILCEPAIVQIRDHKSFLGSANKKAVYVEVTNENPEPAEPMALGEVHC